MYSLSNDLLIITGNSTMYSKKGIDNRNVLTKQQIIVSN